VSGSVIEQAVSNEITMVSPASTSPALTARENNGFFFRVVPNDKMQGEVMARTLEEDGVESISTLYVNNDYGQGFNDVLVDEFNGTVETEVGFDNDATQFSSQVSQASQNDPEAIVVVAYPGNAVPIMSEAFSQGVTAEQKFYFSEGVFSEDFLADVGEDEQGTHVIASCKGTTPQILLDPGPESFQQRFNETYDHRPGLFAAQSYDATVAMALGIAYADSTDPNEFKDGMRTIWNAPGTETSDINEALTLTKAGQDIDWEGPSGAFDWNEDNEPVKGTYGIWQVTEDGSLEIVQQNITASLE
jgi:ABC-type branched-subunit amino acid transport system substrate-binding protein